MGCTGRGLPVDDQQKRQQADGTQQPLQWLDDRLAVISNTDHDVGNGHGKEVSFLSGILPSEANAYAEKNVSFDPVLARYLGSDVCYPSVHAGLKGGIQMSWTANGTIAPVTTDLQRGFSLIGCVNQRRMSVVVDCLLEFYSV